MTLFKSDNAHPASKPAIAAIRAFGGVSNIVCSLPLVQGQRVEPVNDHLAPAHERDQLRERLILLRPLHSRCRLLVEPTNLAIGFRVYVPSALHFIRKRSVLASTVRTMHLAKRGLHQWYAVTPFYR